MTALSLHLSEKIVKASQRAAGHLGISRTEFIRRAVIHELQHYQAELERKQMAKSFAAMKKRPRYLKESKAIDKEFGNEDDTWSGKKS